MNDAGGLNMLTDNYSNTTLPLFSWLLTSSLYPQSLTNV